MIISANVQYARGEHSLLDYSSLQPNYSTALEWAKDPWSNAAIGQYIYIQSDEENHPAGPYIVTAIGENAVLQQLAQGGDAQEKLEWSNYTDESFNDTQEA